MNEWEVPATVKALPEGRVALVRTNLVTVVCEDAVGAARWAFTRSRVVLAAAAAALVAVGSAVAIGTTDFLGQQARVDQQVWTPPAQARVGGRVEIDRGEDWSFMAWRGRDATCVGYAAGAGSNWLRACGRAPTDREVGPHASKYLLVYAATPNYENGAADGRGAIFGAVAPEVANVEMELRGGGVVAVPALPAPTLGEAHFFLARVSLPSWNGFPVTQLTFRSHDGRILERFVPGR